MIRPLLIFLATLTNTSGSAFADVAYPPVRPGTLLSFPRDHGAHPDYRIEWWYLTGWLEDVAPAANAPQAPSPDGMPARTQAETSRPLGFQLTFFRLRPGVQEGNPSTFAPRQLLFAHAAISDPAHGRLRHAEKSARAGFGLAIAEAGDTRVQVDDWSLSRDAADPAKRGPERYRARARGEGFAYDLIAETASPPLLQGEEGYSRKGAAPQHASHYYSRPQLVVSGSVEIDGKTRQVKGRAWLDHEWSSEAMPEGAVGWDWLGANLHDGGALMAFRLRDAQGRALWAGGTLARPGEAPRRFGPADISFTPLRRWKSPRTGGDYAVEMSVKAGERTWRLVPLLDDQELDSRGSVGAVYWEGAVRVFGESGAKSSTQINQPIEIGRGYLEITGVVGKLRM
jgi:predicted secreted hydrolase